MFRLVHQGEIARLTLDRPEARNAIPAGGWRELAALLGQVGQSSARLLVVEGAGQAFCAGADLGDFAAFQGDLQAGARFREDMRAGLNSLRNLLIPTLADVEGPCYGAGVALALACDLRIAGEGARFAVPPARIGLGYPQEDVHRLVELVGTARAARLLFTAETIDGAEAVRIGLAEWHAPEGGAEAIAAAILANAQDSLVDLKRAIRLAAEGRRSDPGQDRRFDALIGGPEVARRLEARRRK